MRFAIQPNTLNADFNGWTLGTCGGFTPEGKEFCHSQQGYATDDIFFLETCVYSILCEEDIFALREDEDFYCTVTDRRLANLRWMLRDLGATGGPRWAADDERFSYDDSTDDDSDDDS